MTKKPQTGPPSELKYYVCLYKMEGHVTWHVLPGRTVEKIEGHLKNQIGGQKVTEKKFFEIDRINGTFEEF